MLWLWSYTDRIQIRDGWPWRGYFLCPYFLLCETRVTAVSSDFIPVNGMVPFLEHSLHSRDTLINQVSPREDSTHGHHQMANTEIKLIIFFAAKGAKALYSQQNTRLGAECGSDRELLIARFRLKLKKVGETTRPFRYNLNLIPMTKQWKWEIDLRD